MELEPITRQEQIIAGKDLEPITRMERFLKEYGGGAGGAVSDEQIKNAVENYLDENPIGVDLSIRGATVGQIVKITAVDDKGAPVAWEAVDFPSGGGLEFIGSFAVEAGVSSATFDLNGRYSRIFIADETPATAALSSGEFTVFINGGWANAFKVGKSNKANSGYTYSVMTVETVINDSGVTFANFTCTSGSANGNTASNLSGTNMPDGVHGIYPIWEVIFTVATAAATFNNKKYSFWGVRV